MPSNRFNSRNTSLTQEAKGTKAHGSHVTLQTHADGDNADLAYTNGRM